MFAITADQVGSRSAADLADAQLAAIDALVGDRLILPVDRTAGDEVQAATEDAAAAPGDRAAHDPRRQLERRGSASADVRLPLPERRAR